MLHNVSYEEKRGQNRAPENARIENEKAQYLSSVGNVVLPHHHQGAKYDGIKHSPIFTP